MSNRAELCARLRQELGDTGAQVVWSDTLLNNLLIEAGPWYSKLWPRQALAYRDVEPGARTFTLEGGVLGIAGVECPPGTSLPQEAATVIGETASRGVRQTWSKWGSTIYLGRPAAGGEVGASKLLIRLLLLWDRLDAAEPWNGPEEDERLLVLWAAAQAYAWLEGQDAKRARNPASGRSAQWYIDQLEREINARRPAASRRMERA